MFFYSVISVVMLLAGPCLLVLLLREVVRAVTPPRRMSAQAACDRCGYAVAGLKGTMCPECGVDLLVSGIRTPALEMRRRGRLGWALFAWTVVCGLMGMVGASIATMVMFSRTTGAGGGATMTTTTATVTSTSGATPVMLLTVSITTEDATGLVESTNVSLAPMSAAQGAALTYFDMSGTRWTSWTDPMGRIGGSSRSGTPDATTISAWIASIQPSGAPSLSADEAQTLADLISQVAAGTDPATAAAGSASLTVTGATTITTPTTSMRAITGRTNILPAIIMPAALAVWVAGLVVIPARRRALKRRFGVTGTPVRPRVGGGTASAPAPEDGAAAPDGAG